MAADAGQHRTHKVFRPRATSHPTALDALALLCQIFQKYRLRLKAELLPTAVHWLRRRIHGQERRIALPAPPSERLFVIRPHMPSPTAAGNPCLRLGPIPARNPAQWFAQDRFAIDGTLLSLSLLPA